MDLAMHMAKPQLNYIYFWIRITCLFGLCECIVQTIKPQVCTLWPSIQQMLGGGGGWEEFSLQRDSGS